MLTPGNVADVTAAPELLARMGRARYVLADKPVLSKVEGTQNSQKNLFVGAGFKPAPFFPAKNPANAVC